MSGAPVVHVVDDDASFIRSVSRLLRVSGFQVATFSSGPDLAASVDGASRGCIVTDLHMPGLDGLQLQGLLAERGILLPIVFLTGRADIPSSVHAMRNGAVDFLEKTASGPNLVAAVQRALACGERQAALRSRFAALTEREREVLREVIRGRMNKQIAADLGIHERTVKLHRTAITSKVGVRSVAELTILSREAGLA